MITQPSPDKPNYGTTGATEMPVTPGEVRLELEKGDYAPIASQSTGPSSARSNRVDTPETMLEQFQTLAEKVTHTSIKVEGEPEQNFVWLQNAIIAHSQEKDRQVATLQKQLEELQNQLGENDISLEEEDDVEQQVTQLEKEIKDLKVEKSSLQLQLMRQVTPEIMPVEVGKAEFIADRPLVVDIQDEVIEIIRLARKCQIDDNLIFHEVRDQDPEVPASFDTIAEVFEDVLVIMVKESKREPLVKQLVDYLQNQYDKINASREINKILAGLSQLYESSDRYGVLMCRTLQLFHADPLPTIANTIYSHLYTEIREDHEGEEYVMGQILDYVYEKCDKMAGLLIIEALQPHEMGLYAWMLVHMRSRFDNLGEEFLEEIFAGKDSIPDTEFLAFAKSRTEIWIPDDAILEILEDDMTLEDAQTLVEPMDEIRVSEIHLFNALAHAYNEKIREDLSFLRSKLLTASGGYEDVPETIIQQIFRNETERNILFGKTTGHTIKSILNRVLKYLEGDIHVKSGPKRLPNVKVIN